MNFIGYAAAVAAFLAAPAAVAQSADGWHYGDRLPFEGSYAGVEAGLIQNHFTLQTSQTNRDDQPGTTATIDYHATSLGAGLFGGHDFRVTRAARIGIEPSFLFGGGTAGTTLDNGLAVSRHLRYGYRVAVRAGYVFTPRVMVYALSGYGENRYRIENSAAVSNVGDWGGGFMLGGGAEYCIARRVGARLDLKHLDSQSWQLFVGVPIRF